MFDVYFEKLELFRKFELKKINKNERLKIFLYNLFFLV